MSGADHYPFITSLIASGVLPTEGMAVLARWARAHPEYEDPFWDELLKIDFSADAETVIRWFTEAFSTMLGDPEVQVVWVSLGDSPEIFYLGGASIPDEGKRGEVMRIVSRADVFGSDSFCELIGKESKNYPRGHKLNELTGAPLWTYFDLRGPDAEEKPFETSTGYAVWQAFTGLCIAEAFRRGRESFTSRLGDRDAVGVYGHFEYSSFPLGRLERDGWHPPDPQATDPALYEPVPGEDFVGPSSAVPWNLLDAPDFSTGIKNVARYGKTPTWETLAREADRFADDAARVQTWFHEAIRALRDVSTANLVVLNLGEHPDLFEVRGATCSNETGGLREVVRSCGVVPGFPSSYKHVWSNWFSFDQAPILARHTRSELSPELVALLSAEQTSEQENAVTGEKGNRTLWYAFVLAAINELLKQNRLDLSTTLGKRPVVPVLAGFRHYFAGVWLLKPRSWSPFAKKY